MFTFLLAAMVAGDWPEFRAHGGNVPGHLPLTWSETESVRWKTPIHGLGWSSPIVAGNRIWLATATEDGRELYAVAADLASGKIVHDIKVFDVDKPPFRHPSNSYASCSPVADAGRVYVHFGSMGTACLDGDTGKVLWQRRDLPCDHWRAPGSSPIVFEDLLLLTFDGYDQQYIAALDKNTGTTRWRTNRDLDYGTDNGDLKKAYSTPLVVNVAGTSLLISPSAVYTQAFDVRTGREVWRVKHGGMNAAARPTLAGGLVILAPSDSGTRMIAVRPDGHGDVTNTHIAWKYGRHLPKRATPVAVGDLLFFGADDGFLTCLEAATGKEVWSQRVGGSFWASPLASDGRIYFFGQDGDMPVIAASREYKLLEKNSLNAGCCATPAAVGDDLIIRTKTHLYRIGAKQL